MSPAVEGRAERFAAIYEASYGAIRAYAARHVGTESADEIAGSVQSSHGSGPHYARPVAPALARAPLRPSGR